MSLVGHDIKGGPFELVWLDPGRQDELDGELRFSTRMTVRDFLLMAESGYLPERVRSSLIPYADKVRRLQAALREGKRGRKNHADRSRAQDRRSDSHPADPAQDAGGDAASGAEGNPSPPPRAKDRAF